MIIYLVRHGEDENDVLTENIAAKEQDTYTADLVVQALGYKPDNTLAEACKGICEKVISIGDCTGIGNIIGATADAYEAVWNL